MVAVEQEGSVFNPQRIASVEICESQTGNPIVGEEDLTLAAPLPG